MSTFHDLTMDSLDGAPVALSDYAGSVCLVVNVASRCGLTPQYTGLVQLHHDFADQGFSVLGFPCNQFLGQEPGTSDEIACFVRDNYAVEFPMFAKVEVNGDDECDLFRHLKAEKPRPDGETDIAWNFTKFLVGRDGRVLARYEPQVTPEDIAADLPNHL